VILDPPSYGHGTSGRAWKLAQDLPPLLERLAELTHDQRVFVLLTCHTPGFEDATLAALLKRALGRGVIEHGALALHASTGRSLPSGHFARWTPRH
jgi:23S rRNA (cytosine1962-C5)-methyltransferase